MCCARFGLLVPPSAIRGRREGRAPDAPAAARAAVVVESTRVVRSHRNHPAFPAQWFTAYTVLSPVIGFLATVAGGVASTDLTPASGCQDHTSFPPASNTLVRSAIRVHRIPPRAGDVAQRPPEWDWMAVNIELIWVFGKPEYFFKRGWTRIAGESLSGKSVRGVFSRKARRPKKDGGLRCR